mmetsp:Transcript_50005/g.100664  ORF Transcript_50005/g.100664 Transcript_50005/m.100664 type:complete len:225 (-) Transcript_50005:1324-1998(-)
MLGLITKVTYSILEIALASAIFDLEIDKLVLGFQGKRRHEKSINGFNKTVDDFNKIKREEKMPEDLNDEYLEAEKQERETRAQKGHQNRASLIEMSATLTEKIEVKEKHIYELLKELDVIKEEFKDTQIELAKITLFADANHELYISMLEWESVKKLTGGKKSTEFVLVQHLSLSPGEVDLRSKIAVLGLDQSKASSQQILEFVSKTGLPNLKKLVLEGIEETA